MNTTSRVELWTQSFYTTQYSTFLRKYFLAFKLPVNVHPRTGDQWTHFAVRTHFYRLEQCLEILFTGGVYSTLLSIWGMGYKQGTSFFVKHDKMWHDIWAGNMIYFLLESSRICPVVGLGLLAAKFFRTAKIRQADGSKM